MLVKKNDYKWLKDFKPGRRFKYINRYDNNIYTIERISFKETISGLKVYTIKTNISSFYVDKYNYLSINFID